MAGFNNLKLELTEEQTARYQEWLRDVVRQNAAEHENVDEVTIAFTFTPLGQFILAHTGNCIPRDGQQIVLQEL